MSIEHMAMYVQDLEMARDFFEKYFHAVAGTKYRNPEKEFSSYFLTFEGGSRLEIMNKTNLAPGLPGIRPGFAHIAFSVGSKENVDQLTKRFQEDGYEVSSGPRVTGDGYYESTIVGLEGNLIEIVE
ncbi:MAG: VOC family protein [Lachnospiraceae bacterium]|nr:VOC family protein [Lachnospiraceae bacterium]